MRFPSASLLIGCTPGSKGSQTSDLSASQVQAPVIKALSALIRALPRPASAATISH